MPGCDNFSGWRGRILRDAPSPPVFHSGDPGGKVSPFVAQAILGDAPGYSQLVGSLTSAGAMRLSYIGYPATNYALERTSNLEPPITWIDQQTNTLSVSGILLFTNAPAPGTNNFWRVRSVP